MHADFLNDDGWAQFDSQRQKLAALAEKFDVYVERRSVNDQGDYHFVIMNKRANHECFYDGAAFEVDMSVNVSDTFQERALAYTQAINDDELLKEFHDLQWSQPKVLYFVTS